MALKVLEAIGQEVGPDNVAASLGFVGSQPSSYPVNTIYLWTSGPHEAVLLVSLKPERTMSTAALQEALRNRIGEIAPGAVVSFEAADLVNQVMSFGSPTPIEVAVTGANLTASRGYAEKLKAEMAKVPALRDLQFGQALDYPVRRVQIDRERAGQLGVTVEEVGRSLVAATSSSRFVTPNYWADPNSGIAYQVQVEVPQHRMSSMEDVMNVPVMQNGAARPLLGDVATVTQETAIGEYNRYNQQRMITVTANVHGEDLGAAANEVFAAVSRAGAPPAGVTVSVRGQVAPMQQTLAGLRSGLGLAVIAIFLLLAAYFQSLKVAVIVIGTIPGRDRRRRDQSAAHRQHVERSVVHGRDHGDRRRRGQCDPAGDLRRGVSARGRRRRCGGHSWRDQPPAADPDDDLRHDRRHGAGGVRGGATRAARPRRHRWSRRIHDRHAAGAAGALRARAASCRHPFAIPRSR